MKKISQINSNYIGTPEKWISFLHSWSELRSETYPIIKQLTNIDFDFTQDSSKFEQISNSQIQENLEKIIFFEKNNFSLPKSYKDFLIATDGNVPDWLLYPYFYSNNQEPFKTKIYSISQLGNLYENEREFYREFIRYEIEEYEISDEIYYQTYNSFETEDDSTRFNENMIKIAENSIDDQFTFFVLLPDEVTADHEYEAYEAIFPDINRHLSFADLIVQKFISQILPSDIEDKQEYLSHLNINPYDCIKNIF